MHSVKALKLLCLGDSLTAGYHGVWPHPVLNTRVERGEPQFHPYADHLVARLAAQGVLFEADVKGFPGKTAAAILDEGKALVQNDAAWEVAIICAGTNDLLQGHNAEEIFPTIEQLHLLVEGCVSRPTIVCTLPPIDFATYGIPAVGLRSEARAYHEQWCELNEMLRKFGQSTRRPCVDWAVALPPVWEAHRVHWKGGDLSLWDDSVHPTSQGYDEMANVIFSHTRLRYISKVDSISSDYATDMDLIFKSSPSPTKAEVDMP